MTTIIHPATVSELSDIVAAFRDSHEATPPTRATYDAVARVLGVADTCTGNSDTATDSVAHTPKAGLSVSFYSVGATHRTETNRPLTAYYVAKWKGAEYRGHVLLSNRGYHADTARGYVCFDQSSYTAVLPDGCRTLVAELVANAVHLSGVSLEDMEKEWECSATYYEISSQLSKASWALQDAARTEKKGQ